MGTARCRKMLKTILACALFGVATAFQAGSRLHMSRVAPPAAVSMSGKNAMHALAATPLFSVLPALAAGDCSLTGGKCSEGTGAIFGIDDPVLTFAMSAVVFTIFLLYNDFQKTQDDDDDFFGE